MLVVWPHWCGCGQRAGVRVSREGSADLETDLPYMAYDFGLTDWMGRDRLKSILTSPVIVLCQPAGLSAHGLSRDRSH